MGGDRVVGGVDRPRGALRDPPPAGVHDRPAVRQSPPPRPPARNPPAEARSEGGPASREPRPRRDRLPRRVRRRLRDRLPQPAGAVRNLLERRPGSLAGDPAVQPRVRLPVPNPARPGPPVPRLNRSGGKRVAARSWRHNGPRHLPGPRRPSVVAPSKSKRSRRGSMICGGAPRRTSSHKNASGAL